MSLLNKPREVLISEFKNIILFRKNQLFKDECLFNDSNFVFNKYKLIKSSLLLNSLIKNQEFKKFNNEKLDEISAFLAMSDNFKFFLKEYIKEKDKVCRENFLKILIMELEDIKSCY